MKKIVILIIALFLVTGCSVKYNVVINEDLSINEEAKISGTEELFKTYYKTTKKHVLEGFLDLYKNSLIEANYQYKLVEGKDPYVVINKKYDNVEDYINNSKLFNDYFDEIKLTEDGNNKKIETIGFHPNDIDNPDRFDVKKLDITITCPYEVKNNNAKYVDKETNTYYYELTEKSNKILLEYDISNKFNPNSDLIKTLAMIFIGVIITWIIIAIMTKKNKKK